MAKAKTLDEVFINTGLAAKWEARGEARGVAIGEEKRDQYYRELVNQCTSIEELKQRLTQTTAN